MLWFAFAAPAVVDVALGVHHTSLLTNNAQQVCALIRGQLSYESGCFCGDILFVLFSGDTLASSDTLILSFWGDFGTSFLRLLCCADREGSNHHHLHMGISSGSSETSVSDVLEEVCCLVYDVALGRKAACARCPWLSCELHVLTAVPSPTCAALLCCLTWTELLDKPISAGSCFCTACQGRNPALGLYFCQVMPHPALCACAHQAGIWEERSSGEGVCFPYKSTSDPKFFRWLVCLGVICRICCDLGDGTLPQVLSSEKQAVLQPKTVKIFYYKVKFFAL